MRTMFCKCVCHQSVPAHRVARTELFDTMVFRFEEHMLPRSETLCPSSGDYVRNLHPRGSSLFKDVEERIRALVTKSGTVRVLA